MRQHEYDHKEILNFRSEMEKCKVNRVSNITVFNTPSLEYFLFFRVKIKKKVELFLSLFNLQLEINENFCKYTYQKMNLFFNFLFF